MRFSRVDEVRAQLARARVYYAQALAEADPTKRHALLMACVYPARSVIELMREAAKVGALTMDLASFDAAVGTMAPRYKLIHQLRSRDFHRMPVRGPGYLILEYEVAIPPYGNVEVIIDPSRTNPRIERSGSPLEKEPTFFLTAHEYVQDQSEPVPLALENLLRTHFEELEACISAFARLQRPWSA